jgi:hypothetical protein
MNRTLLAKGCFLRRPRASFSFGLPLWVVTCHSPLRSVLGGGGIRDNAGMLLKINMMYSILGNSRGREGRRRTRQRRVSSLESIGWRGSLRMPMPDFRADKQKPRSVLESTDT